MREIKFRVWNTEWKMMFYSNHADIERCWDGFEYYPVAIPMNNGKEPPNDCPFISDCILSQYTGLNDRNGKEIYEGDILETTASKITGRGPLQVFYMDGGFLPFHHGRVGQGDCEVIGNIYENLELIESGGSR